MLRSLRIFGNHIISDTIPKTFQTINVKIKYPGNIVTSRNVNTLSPLGTAFNAKPSKLKSLQFGLQTTGLFNVEPLISPEGFHILKDDSISECEDLILEVCSSQRNRKIVEVIDHLSDTLCRVADLSEFVRMSHPQRSFASAAEQACTAIGVLVEKLNTHHGLYEALNDVIINGDKFQTTDIDDHVARLFLHDFEQSGIHLDVANRQKVVVLNEMILTVGQMFMARYLNPRVIPKSDLPDSIKYHFALDGTNVVVSGVNSESKLEVAREAGYKLYLYPDEKQEELLSELLNKRHKMATLCGFPSYAHRSARGSLVETPELVDSFLKLLAKEVRPKAMLDLQELEYFKKFTSSKSLASWDIPYFTSIARENTFDVSKLDIAPYFSLGAVMEGLNDLVTDLYDVTFQLEEPLPGELWSSDVYKLAVLHNRDGLLGHIYCDFYERSGKSHQDCHFTIRGGKQLPDGTYQNPIVVLNLYLPVPTWSAPTLLTPSMVENLFHEMGHALHSMMARTQYQHVTGTRCPTDFAEVPSVLMEFFANDPRVLHRIARHHSTGQKIPIEVLERHIASKSLFAACELQLQTFYSLLDQRYHGVERWPESTTTTNIIEEVQNEYYSVPYVKNTAWQLRFGHLVGYGAKYYSYLVSRAVASWIWQKYFLEDPFSRESGEKFRKEVLVHGGGKPPLAMVSEFLGKEITADSLVSALMLDLDNKTHLVQSTVKKFN